MEISFLKLTMFFCYMLHDICYMIYLKTAATTFTARESSASGIILP